MAIGVRSASDEPTTLDRRPKIETRTGEALSISNRADSAGLAGVARSLSVRLGIGLVMCLPVLLTGCAGTRATKVPSALSPGDSEASADVLPVVDLVLPIPRANAVAAGEGSVWVASSANDGTFGGSILRMDAETGETLADIPVPTVPSWETGGGGLKVALGSVWVVGGMEVPEGLDSLEDCCDGLLLQIDPLLNRVVQEIPLGGFSAGDVDVDPRGVWVSLSTGGGVGTAEIVLVDPERGEVVDRIGLTQDYVRNVIAIDGTVWAHEHETNDAVGRESIFTRVDPETGRLRASVRTSLSVVSVTSGEGMIWGVGLSEHDGNVLFKLDPRTGEFTTLPAGDLDHLIDFGEGGIWGRALRSSGEIGVARFSPQTGREDAWVALPKEASSPVALGVAPGSVWVANYERGVTRIELSRG